MSSRILRSLGNKLFCDVKRSQTLSAISKYSIQVTIEKNDYLIVKNDKSNEKYPLVWLRDNCTCEKCYHKLSQSRIINWNDFDVDVGVKSYKVDNHNSIVIDWQDNHKSKFPYEWLQSRSFVKQNQINFLKDIYKPDKQTWSKDEFENIKRVYNYNDVMNRDEIFFNYLNDLAKFGVVFIEGAPQDPNECRKLCNKVSFIRKTHYGEDFHVQNKPGTNNVAYLNSLLQMHTDLPYYSYAPGVNILHCIVQTEMNGGENLLCDVHYVAEKLRTENKDVFKILTETEINWQDVGEEDGITFNKLNRVPMISLDKYGIVKAVRHSIPQRDSYFTINLEDVKPWYKAFKTFIKMINENAILFKLKPGDMLSFDNLRLVHGRLGYEDTGNVKRHIVGHFIDWDEVYCRMRVLKAKLENKEH